MYVLPDLPYAYDALEPTIGAETMKLHHDKHHKTYVDKTNTLATEAGMKAMPLEDLIGEAKTAGNKKLFNNAAQAWNHAFFWEAMTGDYAAPAGDLATAIDDAFGSLADFRTKFVDEGVNQFGSGWVWLLKSGDTLKIAPSHDAEQPFEAGGDTPLIVCDVWEHAYYLDHKNDRKAFLEAWFDKLANWEFAGKQMAAGNDGYRYPEPTAG